MIPPIMMMPVRVYVGAGWRMGWRLGGWVQVRWDGWVTLAHRAAAYTESWLPLLDLENLQNMHCMPP